MALEAIKKLSLIEDEQEGNLVIVEGFVQTFKIAEKKKGGKYANLMLFDGNTQLKVNIWEGPIQEMKAEHESGKTYVKKLECSVGMYNGNKELTVKKIGTSNFCEMDCSHLYEQDYVDESSLIQRFDKLINFIGGSYAAIIKQSFVLLEKQHDNFIFGKSYDFNTSSGSPYVTHHNFKHGLLAHTLEVCDNIRHILSSKKHILKKFHINEPALYAMAVLHDIGKPACYTEDKAGGYERTFEEYMLKHTVIGGFIVYDAIKRAKKQLGDKFDLSNEECLMLLHGIFSHNGKKEWGSPVEPFTIEAYILHEADRLSGSIGNFISGFETAKIPSDKHSISDEYNKILKKKFFVKREEN